MFVSIFFFSSRRRHTRSLCDWSSDVCSSDLLDVRFLPNPHYLEHLRPLTGRDPAVVQHVESGTAAREFYDRLLPMLDFLLPAYVAEGKTHLTIALGCTGGRHRSVCVADRIAGHLDGREDVRLRVVHRDVELD